MAFNASKTWVCRLLISSLAAMVGFVWYQAPVAHGAARQDSEARISEVIDGLRKRDRALTSFAYNATLHFHRRSMISGRFFDYTVAAQAKVDRLLHRSMVRNAGDCINQATPVIKQNQEYLAYFEETVACDGEATKVYRRAAAFDPRTGEQTEKLAESASVQKGTTREFLFDLDGMIGIYGNRSIAETLAEGPTVVSGERDGVVSLECSYPEDTERKVKYGLMFDIDTRKAMAPVRIEELVKQEDGGKWVVTRELTLGNLSEKAPGIWLPRSFVDIHRRVLFQPHEEHELLEQLSSDSLDFTLVNTRFSDDDFKLRIPRGVVVTDNIRGTRYKSADITDSAVERNARTAKELRAAYVEGKNEGVPVKNDVEGGARWAAAWTVVAILLALTAGASGLAAWWYRRSCSGKMFKAHPYT